MDRNQRCNCLRLQIFDQIPLKVEKALLDAKYMTI